MRFWDASALVGLLVPESTTEIVARLLRSDADIIVAWTATIECVSACVRRRRERIASDLQLAGALTRLRQLSATWNIAEPSTALRIAAEKIVARHALRTGDAIQLASAALTSQDADAPLEFVCFDRRLALAATTEGLRVVPDATF
ncbi:MAG TPA: type II toxin-antitoxin system VapC family toxin [Casimicrobiaceae bacterium]|nr:type II toxin-antitoxin system VapC family toxin [Casimicrobiaceae bacterium]